MLSFILQCNPSFYSVLAKIEVKKQVNRHHFQSFTSSRLSVIKKKSCILHQFAFLFWLPARNFSSQDTCFLPLKHPFLMSISPFSTLFLMARRGFVYTISADIYARRPAFCSKTHCILHHFTLRLAPKRTPFCTKTQCIQHQNAVYLASKRSVFSIKQPKTG